MSNEPIIANLPTSLPITSKLDAATFRNLVQFMALMKQIVAAQDARIAILEQQQVP